MGRWRHLLRALHVAALAARIYLGYKLISLRERRLGLARERAEALRRAHHTRSARRIYDAAVRLQGPTIKLAQVIGSRPDLVPDEYVQVLSRLQDRVPPRPYAVVRQVLERELGRPEEVFAEFEGEPIAAATWAQVHRARLRDGRRVAVKVQYPDLDGIVQVDLSTLRLLLSLLGKLERGLDFMPIVEELQEFIPQELDFRQEARNARDMARIFADWPNVVVPAVVEEHTTRQVLVLEYVDGIKISDVAALERAGIDPQQVARLLLEVYCHQILVHGFFNADPHPGNILVQPGPRMVLLDFGLCRRLPPRFHRGYRRLSRAMLVGETEELVQAFAELGFRTQRWDPALLLAFREAFLAGARPGRAYADGELVAEANACLLRLFRRNPLVDYPREVVLIMRAVGLLSGLGRCLDSRADWIGLTLRYLPPEEPGGSLGHSQALEAL